MSSGAHARLVRACAGAGRRAGRPSIGVRHPVVCVPILLGSVGGGRGWTGLFLLPPSSPTLIYFYEELLYLRMEELESREGNGHRLRK